MRTFCILLFSLLVVGCSQTSVNAGASGGSIGFGGSLGISTGIHF